MRPTSWRPWAGQEKERLIGIEQLQGERLPVDYSVRKRLLVLIIWMAASWTGQVELQEATRAARTGQPKCGCAPRRMGPLTITDKSDLYPIHRTLVVTSSSDAPFPARPPPPQHHITVSPRPP